VVVAIVHDHTLDRSIAFDRRCARVARRRRLGRELGHEPGDLVVQGVQVVLGDARSTDGLLELGVCHAALLGQVERDLGELRLGGGELALEAAALELRLGDLARQLRVEGDCVDRVAGGVFAWHAGLPSVGSRCTRECERHRITAATGSVSRQSAPPRALRSRERKGLVR